MSEVLTAEAMAAVWREFSRPPEPTVMIMSPEGYELTRRYLQANVAPTAIEWIGDSGMRVYWPPLTVVNEGQQSA